MDNATFIATLLLRSFGFALYGYAAAAAQESGHPRRNLWLLAGAASLLSIVGGNGGHFDNEW